MIFDKGISTLLGISIIVLVAVLAGRIFLWQYSEIAKELKPSPTPNITPSPTPSPSPTPMPTPKAEKEIEIISPNGDEEWKWGSTQEIKWHLSSEMEKKIKNEEISSITIDIRTIEKSAGRYLFWSLDRYGGSNLTKDSTSLIWIVGNASPPPGGFAQTKYPQFKPSAKYIIEVCGGITGETFYAICDESDNPFSIVD